jgi:hypothetical protein
MHSSRADGIGLTGSRRECRQMQPDLSAIVGLNEAIATSCAELRVPNPTVFGVKQPSTICAKIVIAEVVEKSVVQIARAGLVPLMNTSFFADSADDQS